VCGLGAGAVWYSVDLPAGVVLPAPPTVPPPGGSPGAKPQLYLLNVIPAISPLHYACLYTFRSLMLQLPELRRLRGSCHPGHPLRLCCIAQRVPGQPLCPLVFLTC